MNVERERMPKPKKLGRWPVPCAFVFFIILLIIA